MPGVIDFGFLTTYGDVDFDVATAPTIYDMYGPAAVENTHALTEALVAGFGTCAARSPRTDRPTPWRPPGASAADRRMAILRGALARSQHSPE